LADPLTAREQQVLELLAGGRIVAAIARHLDVTPRTVGRVVTGLYAKLGARTAAEAVSLGYRCGLLGVGPRAGYRLALVPFREAS
jgi:DNA-binding CsgD family transcriptional regulator